MVVPSRVASGSLPYNRYKTWGRTDQTFDTRPVKSGKQEDEVKQKMTILFVSPEHGGGARARISKTLNYPVECGLTAMLIA